MRANYAIAIFRAENDAVSPAQPVERLADLQGAIAQLPLPAQAVLLLHRRDGYTLDEIAKELGCTRASAAKYLAKALVDCRAYMQAKDYA